MFVHVGILPSDSKNTHFQQKRTKYIKNQDQSMTRSLIKYSLRLKIHRIKLISHLLIVLACMKEKKLTKIKVKPSNANGNQCLIVNV